MKVFNRLTLLVVLVTVGYGLSLCAAYGAQEKQEDTSLVGVIREILLSGEKKGLEKVKKLVEQGAPVNQTYLYETPLSVAVRGELVSIVRYLISQGAQITPDIINEAAGKGDLEMLKLLIEKGGDVNGRDKDGVTPLGWVVGSLYAQPDYEVIEYLVSRGADINKAMKYGTPLVAAILGGHEKIAKFFIEKGAAVTVRFEWPVAYPAQLDRSPEAALVNDASLLHLAALSFLPEITEILIKKGVKPVANKYGMTPLHALALYLPGGPQSEARQKLSDHDKAERGTKIIAALLKNGVDINAQDNWGYTALMRAAAWSPELVIALVAAGAAPYLVNKQGEIALLIAQGKLLEDVERWGKAIKALEEAMKKAKK